MRKSLKIPVSVTILIAALFAFQSFIILNLSQKEDTSEDLLGLIRQETQIRALFLAGQDLPSSVIYKFAVYDANFKPVFSTLTKEPSDFKFSVLSQDGYLYYKSFFLKNSVPFFIVTAKAQDYSKAIFLTSLTLTMLLAALFFTLYLFYVSSVKPYK
ncbi:MAG: sensor histidine kinase, partial [Campylobacter sp.]